MQEKPEIPRQDRDCRHRSVNGTPDAKNALVSMHVRLSSGPALVAASFLALGWPSQR